MKLLYRKVRHHWKVSNNIHNIYYLLLIIIVSACATTKTKTSSISGPEQAVLANQNTFLITEVSEDKSYGYTKRNPIKVGGVENSEGPLNERRYLNALAGPDGEPITYRRQGSCCQFKTENSPFGGGMLDIYEVTWEGRKSPVILYINMYDYGELKAPVGFTIKKLD